MAPPSGIAAADCFNWDERINWTHNEPVDQPKSGLGNGNGEGEGEGGGSKEKRSLRKRMGLTTERKKRNEDVPPFQFRQVPYDEWRKHYAKDAEGNYRGTHAPAEDCLLKPEDVAKWRLGEARTKADLWTRGTERLPVYEEVRAEGEVPGYHDVGERETEGEGRDEQPQRYEQVAAMQEQTAPRREIMNGMTAEEIIAAQKEKQKTRPKGNMTWKERVRRGAEFAAMGAS